MKLRTRGFLDEERAVLLQDLVLADAYDDEDEEWDEEELDEEDWEEDDDDWDDDDDDEDDDDWEDDDEDEEDDDWSDDEDGDEFEVRGAYRLDWN